MWLKKEKDLIAVNWLYNLKKEDKIDLTEDRVKDMLKFAVEREYYEKAAILRDFLKNKNKSIDE